MVIWTSFRARITQAHSRLICSLLLLCITLTGIIGINRASAQEAVTSAVILMYHRFGEDDYASTSVTMEQFQAHVTELTSGKYTVTPLSKIVEALKAGTPLPERTIALTIDDAYASVYNNAWPILKREGLPFTLFVATEPVDKGSPDFMTWDQIAELQASGLVEIGSQAVTHPHMPLKSATRNSEELTLSADRLQEKTGTRPSMFAYPYGEASHEVMTLAQEGGYSAAFGQHSGVANSTSDMFYLPRFPINVNYGGVERFTRLINALPLPVSGLTPSNPTLPAQGQGNPPAFGFTVEAVSENLSDLKCYHSDASQISQFEQLGNRFEVRFDSAFAPGRTRVNCTMLGHSGRWRWFGMQYYVPPE
ncbi:MAG: polysaccharide deacetylase family protein [Alphaproteobacteria bacterium]|nr:polysaccharide deacetylase family protein [Alphaproteobacteria bacterium]